MSGALETFVQLVGYKGLIGMIGIMIFLFCYKYSVGIFDFVERQTLGTRTYILEKAKLLFIELNPDHVTYTLLGISVGAGSLVFLVIAILGKWVLGFFLGAIVTFIGFKIPKPFVDFLVDRRIKEYQGQMVDGLTLLSNGIRAGQNLNAAIGMVVDEMPDPISQEFNLILQENRVGVPLEECFENLAKRVPTQDNEMFVASINILRETGGNLSEVFDTIVGVIRERIRLQQKIETVTAQGKFQGYTIGAMPFVIFLIFGSNDPTVFTNMLTKPMGIAAFIFVCILDAIGIYVIMRIVKIKD